MPNCSVKSKNRFSYSFAPIDFILDMCNSVTGMYSILNRENLLDTEKN